MPPHFPAAVSKTDPDEIRAAVKQLNVDYKAAQRAARQDGNEAAKREVATIKSALEAHKAALEKAEIEVRIGDNPDAPGIETAAPEYRSALESRLMAIHSHNSAREALSRARGALGGAVKPDGDIKAVLPLVKGIVKSGGADGVNVKNLRDIAKALAAYGNKYVGMHGGALHASAEAERDRVISLLMDLNAAIGEIAAGRKPERIADILRDADFSGMVGRTAADAKDHIKDLEDMAKRAGKAATEADTRPCRGERGIGSRFIGQAEKAGGEAAAGSARAARSGERKNERGKRRDRIRPE